MMHNEKRDALIKAKMANKMPKAKIQLKKPRLLTEAERKEKTKNWPKGKLHEMSEKEKVAYQHRIGRAYND